MRNKFSDYISNYEVLNIVEQKKARLKAFPETYSIHKSARELLSKIDYKFLFESYWGTNISPEIDLQRNDRDMHELEEYYSSISTEEFVLLILTSELTRVFEKYHKIEKK